LFLYKAMGLWNYLKDRKGTLVDWNEDGEVSVHGQSVIGSHMIDLVKHAVTPLSKKRPYDNLFVDITRVSHELIYINCTYFILQVVI
jgi:hypothetical protein